MFKKHHAYATSIVKNRDMYQNMMADYFLMWTQVLPFTKDSVPRSFNAESHFDLHNGPMRQGLLWPIEEEGESVRLTDLPSCHSVSLCWCWGLILPPLVAYSHALSSMQSHLPGKASVPNHSLGFSMSVNSWSQLSSVCIDAGTFGCRL